MTFLSASGQNSLRFGGVCSLDKVECSGTITIKGIETNNGSQNIKSGSASHIFTVFSISSFEMGNQNKTYVVPPAKPNPAQ